MTFQCLNSGSLKNETCLNPVKVPTLLPSINILLSSGETESFITAIIPDFETEGFVRDKLEINGSDYEVVYSDSDMSSYDPNGYTVFSLLGVKDGLLHTFYFIQNDLSN